MKLTHRATVDAAPERVWALLLDVPAAAPLVPGVEAVEPLGEGRYRGRLRVQLGPVRLSLDGEIAITARDDAARRATLRATGTDARAGGGVRAILDLALSGRTDLAIDTDVQVLGRVGELGGPFVKRRADRLMDEFVANLRRAVEA